LWPLVETFLGSHDVAGLAVAVVGEGEVVSRGFGVRDVGTGASVTPETMFHLASMSKPFVATAIVSLATAREAGDAAGFAIYDLVVLSDISAVSGSPSMMKSAAASSPRRRLLTLAFIVVASVLAAGWYFILRAMSRELRVSRLQSEPGSVFSYSNAGFELLGLLLSRVTGTTFENAVRQQVLASGMRNSTFLRSGCLCTWPPHRTWGCR
jgi:CubicO group peptidase (beta-lactamase class C family)